MVSKQWARALLRSFVAGEFHGGQGVLCSCEKEGKKGDGEVSSRGVHISYMCLDTADNDRKRRAAVVVKPESGSLVRLVPICASPHGF